MISTVEVVDVFFGDHVITDRLFFFPRILEVEHGFGPSSPFFGWFARRVWRWQMQATSVNLLVTSETYAKHYIYVWKRHWSPEMVISKTYTSKKKWTWHQYKHSWSLYDLCRNIFHCNVQQSGLVDFFKRLHTARPNSTTMKFTSCAINAWLCSRIVWVWWCEYPPQKKCHVGWMGGHQKTNLQSVIQLAHPFRSAKWGAIEGWPRYTVILRPMVM